MNNCDASLYCACKKTCIGDCPYTSLKWDFFNTIRGMLLVAMFVRKMNFLRRDSSEVATYNLLGLDNQYCPKIGTKIAKLIQ